MPYLTNIQNLLYIQVCSLVEPLCSQHYRSKLAYYFAYDKYCKVRKVKVHKDFDWYLQKRLKKKTILTQKVSIKTVNGPMKSSFKSIYVFICIISLSELSYKYFVELFHSLVLKLLLIGPFGDESMMRTWFNFFT